MNYIKLMLKGFIVGIGKIVPGVSGGMLAMVLGIYEESVQAIAHFFHDIKKNTLFLGILGIGVLFAIVFMSGIIEFSLKQYYLPTMLLFIGLMLGGFSSIKKEIEGTNVKHYLPQLIIPFVFMLGLTLYQGNQVFIFDGGIKGNLYIFLFGIIDAFTMVVPGISGTAILMLLGFYPMLIETFSHLFDIEYLNHSLQIILPFGLGLLVGIFITVKLVSYLLEKRSISFHYIIVSFFLSSILMLFIQTLKVNYSISTIFIGILFLIVGYFISKTLEEHYNS